MSQEFEEIRRRIQQVRDGKSNELDMQFIFSRITDERETETVIKEICELDQLQTLDLSYNKLTSLPDWLGNLTNLSSLYLGENKLTSLPDWFANFTNLSSLDLSYNKLESLPDWFANFTNLSSLNLYNNNLTSLPDWLGNLTNLSSLYLGGNKLTSLPDWLGNLTNLSSLYLSGNKLTSLPDWFANFTNLSSLYLSGNKLTSLPDWFANFTNLSSLGLSGNNLTSLPDWLGTLTNLSWLDLRALGLSSLPDWLGTLTNLSSLNLSGNNLTSLPDWFANFTNLSSLDLSCNRFREFPSAIYQLHSLKQLRFNNFDLNERKNQIKQLSADILRLDKLQELNLSDNPMEEPPLEVVKQGIEAIRNYFRQREEEGLDYIYEAKLLILGESGAGKTSLAKKIQNDTYQLQKEGENPEESTKGIEVAQWYFDFDKDRKFRVNIWDFGGQEIYHSTHQFFLTKRSLYFLVADNREEDTDFYYWLNIVELLTENSPLLIIKNEKQDRKRDISEQQLRGQFTNLKETLETNLATNRGLEDIRRELKHYICKLPHVGAALPKTWVKVREALEQEARNYISLEAYLNLCQQHGFTRREDKLQLSQYLHDLGVFLHFQDDELLNKTVILKPRWGTDAAYKVLDNPTVINNQGKFTKRDLADIWQDAQYEGMRDELLRLMIKFKICYPVVNTAFYIAPQLLTTEQPVYDWDAKDNLVLRYIYEFMPKGILTQLIVAMHTLIVGQQLVWRYGVVLEQNDTRAEVIESYGKREIRVRVSGKLKKELLTIIHHEFGKIHAAYTRLRYNVWIPCNCEICKSSKKPHEYTFEALRKFVVNRQAEIQCQNSFQMVKVLGLIDDIADRRIIESQDGILHATGMDYRVLFDRNLRKSPQVLVLGNATVHTGKGDISVLDAERDIAMQDTKINQAVGRNIIQNQKGDNKMAKPQEAIKVRSAWANGSFYLFTFAIVITGLGVLARSVPVYVLPIVLIAAPLIICVIGAFQLKQDDRLSEKSFLELMKLTLQQLPLIGRFFRKGETDKKRDD